MTESQTQPRELSPRVHAQLFIKHALAAESLSSGSQSQTVHEEVCASRGHPHRLRISDTRDPNIIHSLVFGRVRVYGIVVGKSVAEIDSRKCTFYYIDDTTGIIPFMLCPCTRGARVGDLTERSVMETRMSQGRVSDDGLVGTSLVVMGQICHSPLPSTQSSRTNSNLSADQPATWIRGHMVDIRTDPMSDIAAMVDTWNTYAYYFPSYGSLPSHSHSQSDNVVGANTSPSMRMFIQSQLSSALHAYQAPGQLNHGSKEHGQGEQPLNSEVGAQRYVRGVASSSELHISPHPPSAKRVRVVHIDGAYADRHIGLHTFNASHPAEQASPTSHIRKKPRGGAMSEQLSSDLLGDIDIDSNMLFDGLDDLDPLLPSEVPAVRAFLQSQGNTATHDVLVAKLGQLGSNPEEAIEDMLLAGVLTKKGGQYTLV